MVYYNILNKPNNIKGSKIIVKSLILAIASPTYYIKGSNKFIEFLK